MERGNRGYVLLDSGDGKRLEVIGPYTIVRPAPQAFWRPHLPPDLWDAADALYHRSSSGGGAWEYKIGLPASWPLELEGLTFHVRLTGFGHIGVFPEQTDNWHFISDMISKAGGESEVLNLFGYTGAATLFAARAGARVCHVDASKGVVEWARSNACANGLDGLPVRWIIEDVIKFLEREERRGNKYHGLILDPPAFGRGNKGEVWKIEQDLCPLLSACRSLLHKDAGFITLSTYSPKFTPLVLANMMGDAFGDRGGAIETGEMVVHESGGRRVMPNGIYARWTSGRK